MPIPALCLSKCVGAEQWQVFLAGFDFCKPRSGLQHEIAPGTCYSHCCGGCCPLPASRFPVADIAQGGDGRKGWILGDCIIGYHSRSPVCVRTWENQSLTLNTLAVLGSPQAHYNCNS